MSELTPHTLGGGRSGSRSPVTLITAATAAVLALASCAQVANTLATQAGPVAPAGIEMVHIRAGAFVMGCPADEDGRRPDEIGRSRVAIKSDYYLGRYPVTVGQWRAVMGYAPGQFGRYGDDIPVTGISWNEAVSFCQKLTAQEGAAGRLPAGCEYALPTEAQWEYAARAGTTALRYGELDAIGWFRGNSGGHPHPVGQKAPNAWGLYGMIGSVWQWCANPYERPLPVVASGDIDSVQYEVPPPPPTYTLRGGSWLDTPDRCRAAARRHNAPDYRGPALGFRLALVAGR